MKTTLHELHKRGHGRRAGLLRSAFTAAFLKPDTAPVTVVEGFWDEFVVAHRLLYRGGARKEAA